MTANNRSESEGYALDGGPLNVDMGELWFASFSSFRGIVAGATHWHVRVTGPKHEMIVEWRIDAPTAAEWTRADDTFPYEAGERSQRFTHEHDAIEAVKVAFDSFAGPNDLLVRGHHAVLDPAEPLAGNSVRVAEARVFYDQAEACGWYEGDKDAMNEITDRFDAWRKSHFVERDTTFERSDYRRLSRIYPEDNQVIVVERDGPNWKVSDRQDDDDEYEVHGDLIAPPDVDDEDEPQVHSEQPGAAD